MYLTYNLQRMFIRTRLVNWITFGFASGITLFPFVLVAPQVPLKARLVRHEKIHLEQQKELLVLPFYLLYLLDYLFRLLKCRNHYLAYRHISFEREAYENDHKQHYLSKRKPWSWLNYL